MKFQISKEWLARHAHEDDLAEITAGTLDDDRFLADVRAATQQHGLPDDVASPAFGKLVNLFRRKLGFTVEELATRARVELAELVEIEENAHFRPEPRTVYQLAGVFHLPVEKLMQLSGNVRIKNSSFQHWAVKFAARSKSVDRLNDEEHTALEEFVKHITERSD